jgi:hypothetical protein
MYFWKFVSKNKKFIWKIKKINIFYNLFFYISKNKIFKSIFLIFYIFDNKTNICIDELNR